MLLRIRIRMLVPPPPRRRATAASTLKAATADVGHEEARHRINVSARLQVCRPGGVFCLFFFSCFVCGLADCGNRAESSGLFRISINRAGHKTGQAHKKWVCSSNETAVNCGGRVERGWGGPPLHFIVLRWRKTVEYGSNDKIPRPS